jgi:hypothetical protein
MRPNAEAGLGDVRRGRPAIADFFREWLDAGTYEQARPYADRRAQANAR